jgi:hypothetical protein
MCHVSLETLAPPLFVLRPASDPPSSPGSLPRAGLAVEGAVIGTADLLLSDEGPPRLVRVEPAKGQQGMRRRRGRLCENESLGTGKERGAGTGGCSEVGEKWE